MESSMATDPKLTHFSTTTLPDLARVVITIIVEDTNSFVEKRLAQLLKEFEIDPDNDVVCFDIMAGGFFDAMLIVMEPCFDEIKLRKDVLGILHGGRRKGGMPHGE